ncbi:MAG TPA: CBU_0585 family protein [Coxiellaceae bacterium]|nr:CBU_0585 family protein [Coxiellaceae bacterium]
MSKIDKHFVSNIDKKMAEFNATHPKSAAQQAEYEKYQRIYHLRDVPTDQHITHKSVWD